MKPACRIRHLMLIPLLVLYGKISSQSVHNDFWNNTVSHIIKDSRGIMWMDGNYVTSFDGINFIGHDKGSSSTYSSGTASSCICELDNGKIAYGNRSGLYVTSYNDETSERVDPDVTDVTSIVKVKDGNTSLLVVGCKQGVRIYDSSLGTNTNTILINKGSIIGHENAIVAMATDGKHNVWAINHYGTLLHLDTRSGVGSTYKLPQTQLTGSVNDLALRGEELFIASANNGLLIFNTHSHATSRSTKIEAHVIKQIRNFNDTLYVCTDGSGAYLMTEDDVCQLRTESNTVYAVHHDSELNIDWFGYYRAGFSYTQPSHHIFNTYKYKDFTTEGLFVRSFCKRGAQTVLGTRDGAYLIDEQRDIVRHYTPEEIGGAIILDVIYFEGRYILANFEHGLYSLDPITLQLSIVPMPERLQQASYSRMVLSPDRKKIYAASNVGLIVLDNKMKVIEEHNETQSDILTSYIYDIAFDDSGKLWISTQGGMCLFNPETNRIQSKDFPEGFFNDESNLSFSIVSPRQMLAASEQALFSAATNLSWFKKHDVFERLGLCYVNFAQPLQVGGSMHYLLGTDKGLFLFDERFDNFRQFGQCDGLPSAQFNRDNCIIDHQGILWMATTNGLVYLTRQDREKLVAPLRSEVFIGQYTIDGKHYTANFFEEENNSIVMGWNFESKELVISPFTLDYHPSASSRYYEWSIDGGARHVAFDKQPIAISALTLGEHHLSIRIAGHPETEIKVTVKVVPSLMLLLEMLVVLILIVVIIISLRLHSRHKQLMALVRQKHTLELQLASINAVSDHIKANEEQRIMHEEKKKIEKQEQVRHRSQSYKELERLVKKYMEEEQPYLRSNLRISDVAAHTGTNVATLSQMFNDYLHTTFYDFINSYRLEEFKRRISSEDGKDFTITAISEMCGFKRSTFFATFKKFEDCTPNEWMNKTTTPT